MNKDLPSRVVLIDIIRGFALLGIILVRADYTYFGEYPAAFIGPGTIDNALAAGIDLLLKNKFYTIFSFLFGIGFAIQIQSAARKQQPFKKRFLWRLFFLLVIGCLHALIYHSDILRRYALLGLLLIPLRNLKDTYIWVISIAFFLLTSLNIYFSADMAVYFDSLNPGKFVQNELIHYLVQGRLGMIAGLFTLGFYAGRKQIFSSKGDNDALFRRILLASTIVSILSTAALYLKWPAPDVFPIARTIFSLTQIIAVSAMYLSGVALLYMITPLAGVLSWLAPIGRMGLTNYLLQSVFFLLLEHTNLQGLFPGLAGIITVSLLFFILQILFSQYWLNRFRWGPAEWLWRYATDRMSGTYK